MVDAGSTQDPQRRTGLAQRNGHYRHHQLCCREARAGESRDRIRRLHRRTRQDCRPQRSQIDAT
jgi:hypothetical protein